MKKRRRRKREVIDEEDDSEVDEEVESLPTVLLLVSGRKASQEEIEEACSADCWLIRHLGHCPGKENCEAHVDSGIVSEIGSLEATLGPGFHIVSRRRHPLHTCESV